MIDLTLALAALLLAAVPTVFFVRNLRLYAPAPAPAAVLPPMSVLIPARNEEAAIRTAIASVLDNTGVRFEVLVLDDNSSDRTAEIVNSIAAVDQRVRLERAPLLPSGWCGKQHACAILARRARFPLLCFMDADVELAPDALSRMATFLEAGPAVLVSGFPRQLTKTWLEKLLIPLIHFVLLGFLPLDRMRASTHPAYAAACGQLILVRRDDYEQTGGHAAIRNTLHDGLKLPALLRASGRHTDLFDATDIASCRMYRSAREVWFGLAKNATEGMAAPGRIVPFTLMLAVGQVAPAGLTIAGMLGYISPVAAIVASLALVLSYVPRLFAVRRFRQSTLGAAAHPVGILVLLAIQWFALARKSLGRPAAWKGRNYAAVG